MVYNRLCQKNSIQNLIDRLKKRIGKSSLPSNNNRQNFEPIKKTKTIIMASNIIQQNDSSDSSSNSEIYLDTEERRRRLVKNRNRYVWFYSPFPFSF